jgi:glycosyltransferase involved in cell wall biosynthesis
VEVGVVLEYRFVRGTDGGVYSRSAFSRGFWNRYLTVFDLVGVCARVEAVSSLDGYGRMDDDRVRVDPLPSYVGPAGFARRAPAASRVLRRLARQPCAVVLRVPSALSMIAARQLRSAGKPFAVEVVGDPLDVFARGGGVDHPLRGLFRFVFHRGQRALVRKAAAVGYVTRSTLQRRYPAASGAFATHYSSVELDEGWFGAQPPRPRGRRALVVTVASLAQAYKGVDILLQALRQVRLNGRNVTLRVIGDGKERANLQSQANALGIANAVEFSGELPHGEPIREALDAADAFVLASRTEGLPRAMIEAMARGVPCVGTKVGGIPELLPPEWLVERNDPEGLAARIASLLDDPERARQAGERNREVAREYRSEELAKRRTAMYRHLRAATEEWLARRGR